MSDDRRTLTVDLFGPLLIYGVLIALLLDLYHLVPRWLGLPTPVLFGMNDPSMEITSLTGLRQAVAQVVSIPGDTIRFNLIGVMMLLVLRIVLRRHWPAYVGWVVLGVLLFNPGTGPAQFDLTFALALMLVALFTLVRFGLLTMVAAVAIYALRISLGGNSLFRPGVLAT